MSTKETKLENIKLIYTSPAFPQNGININDSYTIGRDMNGIYFRCRDVKHYENFELIKALFTPVKHTWEEIDTLLKNINKK